MEFWSHDSDIIQAIVFVVLSDFNSSLSTNDTLQIIVAVIFKPYGRRQLWSLIELAIRP